MTDKLQRKIRVRCATETGTCICPFYQIDEGMAFCTGMALPIGSESYMVVKVMLSMATVDTIRGLCPLRKSDITIVLKEGY